MCVQGWKSAELSKHTVSLLTPCLVKKVDRFSMQSATPPLSFRIEETTCNIFIREDL